MFPNSKAMELQRHLKRSRLLTCWFFSSFMTRPGDVVTEAAAEIFFGSIPFEVHPHRMKVTGFSGVFLCQCLPTEFSTAVEAIREDILAVFASALLKKMMTAWMKQANV